MAGTLTQRATVRKGALGVDPRSVLDSGLHRLDGVGDPVHAQAPVAERARLRARGHAHEPVARHLQCRHHRRDDDRVNVSTALRQPLLTPITGPLFWVPLAVVGYPPAMILTAQAWSLLYQFWIHTETIDRLGPLEWIMNTPSHHRVHHGANVEYLDRNHAGIFIIWDRLFGTFEREEARVVYGLTTNVHTFHLAKVGFHAVVAMAKDVVRAPTLRAKLGYIFAPFGWCHDGSSHTASQLRALLGKSPVVVHTERPLD